MVALSLLFGLSGEAIRAETLHEFDGRDYVKQVGASGCWTAGAEAVFVRPQWEENLAFTKLEADGLGNQSYADNEFDNDFDLAPRLWFGYESAEGIGIRARYWEFDQAAATAVGAVPSIILTGNRASARRWRSNLAAGCFGASICSPTCAPRC